MCGTTMSSEVGNLPSDRDPGDETSAGCDIYGYPVTVTAFRLSRDERSANPEPSRFKSLVVQIKDRDEEIMRLRAENKRLQTRGDFWLRNFVEATDLYLRPSVGQSLSAGWHHLPCITTGLPDPRRQHPVIAAIRKTR